MHLSNEVIKLKVNVSKMKLRKLENKDADRMLEWMHDDNVVEFMQADFKNKTIDDCENFIRTAKNDICNCHMAIVNDNDEYMGTVSLKNIQNDNAEFAITICRDAMGMGYSKFGMHEIIRYGFEELDLANIYWCVSPENKRAIKFYDKNGYPRHKIDAKFSGGATPRNRFRDLSGIRFQKRKCKKTEYENIFSSFESI